MTWLGLTEGYLLGMLGWIAGLGILFVMLLKLRRRWKQKPRRKRLAHLGLSLWLLALLCTLLELGFALLYDSTDSFNLSNVSQKWFRKYAEPFEHALIFRSDQGIVYRDDQTFPASIPDRRRHACFLGDSFAYGHGVNRVEDRFSNRVRSRLEEEAPGAWIVTNLAKPGTDLQWAEAILKNLFDDGRRVDRAIFTICLNDIESFAPAHGEYYEGHWRAGSNFFLFRDTYFFNLLYFRIAQFNRPEVRSYYDFVRDYYDGEPWEKMTEKIRAMDDLCRNHECRLEIAIFPFLHNLGTDYEFEFAHEKLREFCEQEQIPVVDLLPVLQPHVKEGLVVSRFDAHPNETAHGYAAEAIYEQFFKQ
jgi:hypothetical protein